MTTKTRLNDLIKWADKVQDHTSLTALKAEAQRVGNFVTDVGDRKLLSCLRGKIQESHGTPYAASEYRNGRGWQR